MKLDHKQSNAVESSTGCSASRKLYTLIERTVFDFFQLVNLHEFQRNKMYDCFGGSTILTKTPCAKA